MKRIIEIEDLRESCKQLERRNHVRCMNCAENMVILRTEVLRISSSKPRG